MQVIGIDVGGTFTDFVLVSSGTLQILKVPTTKVQSLGIAGGMARLQPAATGPIIHGTTIATNALLQRSGAHTALLTTRGFTDVLAIGRQNRPHLYQLSQQRRPPLAPQSRRFEVSERLSADGEVVIPLCVSEVSSLAEHLLNAGVESVAIVFLFSYMNAEHEQHAAALLRDYIPGIRLSLSSDIIPEYREYERTATTVINAYVQPLVSRYLQELAAVVHPRTLRVMQSSGGTVGTEQAAREPARLVLSGPAGGVAGAFGIARQVLDDPRIITFDMGGTSTDVALCPGRIPHTTECTIAGLPLRLPCTRIHTVGAGGGSIARIGAGGLLHVGPESAGAVPGPICYRRGGVLPTVTDANVVLGRMVSDRVLGGMPRALDVGSARALLRELGEILDMDTETTALGIVRVANAAMERALRRVSLERGYDPRSYTLVPFGGAGPLHACELAEALGIRRILVPRYPGVLSALGLLMADVTADSSSALLHSLETLENNPDRAGAVLASLRRRVLSALGSTDATLMASLDLRYRGQSYELQTPVELPLTAATIANARQRFHDLHERRYGYAAAEQTVESTAIRLRGSLPGADVSMPAEPLTDSPCQPSYHSPVWLDMDGPVSVPCYERQNLCHGQTFTGPAIVFQYDATLLVTRAWQVTIDARANAILQHEPD